MLYFNCDYTEGCHPRILEKLAETNLTQTVGYGEDEYCQAARALIRKECGREDVDVHFLVGGTQANFTVIRAALRPHQGAIAPVTGHINGHETGAVEATGHKVLALPCGPEGKLTAAQVEETVAAHWADEAREHLVQPKLVYISHPTENGALYTRSELEALSRVCRERGLYLFLDGARLGLWTDRPGDGHFHCGPGPAVRCVLHRRHQVRRPLWRGCGHRKPRAEAGLPLRHQAERRHAGQGQAAGAAVPGIV